MIKSMTAFANSETEIDNWKILCEIRSVNHRYNDITIKLPEKLRFCETDLRSLISSQIKRGKIECALNFKKQATEQLNFIINEQAVKALFDATTQIEEHMHSQQAFTAMDVLNFPGIQQEPAINKESLLSGINDLVKQTLDQLVAAREKEGAQLMTLIHQRCEQIIALAESAKQRLPEVMAKIRDKIKRRFTELSLEPDHDRLEQELVFLVQKMDISEEIDRLDTHAKEVMHILNLNEPIGRRLDFLMQEMNREANTLGSKSADKEMTGISITLKVLIEQMREQIQNIE